MKFSKCKRRCNAWYWFFLDAIYYPQRENKNPKLLLNFTSHVFIISQFKKKHLFIFCLFIISAQVFQCSNGIFMQTRTCSYEPRNMRQPMPGTDKMLQNLNLISSKSQMFSILHDVCFSCAWDSSFGKNGDDQSLFVGWFELHWLAMSSQVLMRLSSPAHHRTPSSLL